ncbi:MAG: acetolactate synthase large subunit, partial [Rhodospirillaceae bacterium]|nr:acetolactate synthase large subunit [Rhodospirillaceae bacterium]
MTLAEAMIATLKSHGVKFLFGVPGGGSSLDLIAAADRAGLHFILCRGETSAAIAAAVVGELTGAPGVVLTAIGPGAA